jgi:enoyl-CoA hydratase/carnithine racemase
LLEKEGGIAILTLNRPKKMNAISPAMREGIPRALDYIAEDDDIKVLILTGAGQAFCSGADVSDLRSGAGAGRWIEVKRAKGTGFHMGPLLWRFEKPTIAAINGVAIGAGFGLALSCDMRIASDQARLAPGYVRMGLATEWGISYILPRIVGVSRALEMLLTGDFIQIVDAESMGLVSKVVAGKDLMDTVRKTAGKIAAGPSFAHRQIKQAIRNGLNSDYNSQIEYEAYVQSMCRNSQDHKEATTAFLEKREPKFKGV